VLLIRLITYECELLLFLLVCVHKMFLILVNIYDQEVGSTLQ